MIKQTINEDKKILYLLSAVCLLIVFVISYFGFALLFPKRSDESEIFNNKTELCVAGFDCKSSNDSKTNPTGQVDVPGVENPNTITKRPFKDFTITDDAPGKTSDRTFDSGLSINFPTSWKLTHNTRETYDDNGDISYESFDYSDITSPDESVKVLFRVILQGQHGGPKYDTGPFADYVLSKMEYQSIDGFPDAYFTNYMTNYDGRNTFYFGLNSSKSTIESIKAGDASDDLIYGEIVGINTLLYKSLIVWAEIKFSDNTNDLTSDEFDEIINSDNYMIAKEILLSLSSNR